MTSAPMVPPARVAAFHASTQFHLRCVVYVAYVSRDRRRRVQRPQRAGEKPRRHVLACAVGHRSPALSSVVFNHEHADHLLQIRGALYIWL